MKTLLVSCDRRKPASNEKYRKRPSLASRTQVMRNYICCYKCVRSAERINLRAKRFFYETTRRKKQDNPSFLKFESSLTLNFGHCVLYHKIFVSCKLHGNVYFR